MSDNAHQGQAPSKYSPGTVLSVFWTFLRLGLTSFGGPVAHLGFFREEFVVRKRWLSEASYVDLVALCQFLPGPGSSQVGLGLGLMRAGYGGALAAWLGFTLPSAIALVLVALGLGVYAADLPNGLLQGLKVAALAVVVQAVWGMARSLCPDTPRVTLMAISACALVLSPFAWMPVIVILCAGVVGLALLRPADQQVMYELWSVPVSRRGGAAWLMLFVVLLVGLPLLAAALPSQTLAMVDAFYRVGSLVFGGGHVVLPLLQAEVVPAGWVDEEMFLAGYGITQAVPGPLFTFAAFLGAVMETGPSGWLGALICLVAIFLPSFLLVAGVLPFWAQWRQNLHMRAALMGINAAVVGILLAALYDPISTAAITGPGSFALALIAVVALMFWRWPTWAVVIVCPMLGWGIGLVG